MEKVSYPTQAPTPHAPTTSQSSHYNHQSADINVDVQAPPSYEQATGAGMPITQQPTQLPPLPQHQPQPLPQIVQPTAYQGAYGVQTTQIGWSTHPQQTTFAYATQQQGAQPTVIQTPQVVLVQPTHVPLGSEPAFLTCPHCHVQKLTRISYEPNARTHVMALLLCLFGFWCCMCMPYCIGSCMSTNHYCGNCNQFLGSYGAGEF